jgi:hypothetical protein
VSEIVLPDGSTASEVIGPDGNVVFEAGPDIPDSGLEHQFNFEQSLHDELTTASFVAQDGEAYSTTAAEGDYATDLDGGDDYHVVSNADLNIDWLSEWTVVMAVRRSTYGSSENPFWTMQSWRAKMSSTNQDLICAVYDGSRQSVTFTSALSSDTYHLIGLSYSSTDGNVKGWLDSGSNNKTTPSGDPASTGDVAVGNDAGGNFAFDDMLGDGLLMYSRRISDSEFDDIASTYVI